MVLIVLEVYAFVAGTAMAKSASCSWLCMLFLWTLLAMLSCLGTSLNDAAEGDLPKQTMTGAKFTTLSTAQAAKEAISELFDRIKENARETAHLIMQKATDISWKVRSYMPDTAQEAKVEKKIDEGKSESITSDAYDQAKQRVCESCKTAKDTVSEESRITYEAANEELSKATGDLGTQLRKGHDEL